MYATVKPKTKGALIGKPGNWIQLIVPMQPKNISKNVPKNSPPITAIKSLTFIDFLRTTVEALALEVSSAPVLTIVVDIFAYFYFLCSHWRRKTNWGVQCRLRFHQILSQWKIFLTPGRNQKDKTIFACFYFVSEYLYKADKKHVSDIPRN